MKTVKRKAEVGEKVLTCHGSIGEVLDSLKESINYKFVDGRGHGRVKHDQYEVIIEDDSDTPPHSSHYHKSGLDPLAVMRQTFTPEQYEGFLRGNVLKYAMRYDMKGQQVADLEKMNFYGRELEVFKRQQNDR